MSQSHQDDKVCVAVNAYHCVPSIDELLQGHLEVCDGAARTRNTLQRSHRVEVADLTHDQSVVAHHLVELSDLYGGHRVWGKLSLPKGWLVQSMTSVKGIASGRLV